MATPILSPQWADDARHALVEAQTMSEALGALLHQLKDGADKEAFPLLEACTACVMRLERAIAGPLDAALDAITNKPAATGETQHA